MLKQGEEMVHDGESMIKDGEKMMEEGESMIKEGEAMMEKDGDSAMMEYEYRGEVLSQGTDGAVLLDFNQVDYEAAIAEGKLVTLFFYANWCPTCRVEFPRMENAFKELSGDVVGFRVNYNDNQTDDYEKELARAFGVAYQHTKVFVKNGERILKSPESWDQNRYITEINNAL